VPTSSACRDLLLIQQLNKQQIPACGACRHYYPSPTAPEGPADYRVTHLLQYMHRTWLLNSSDDFLAV